MKHWLGRMVWASLLGMGVMAGLARGQETVPVPSLPPGTTAIPLNASTIPPGTGVVPLSPQLHAPGMGGPPAGYAQPDPGVYNWPRHGERHRIWSQPPIGCATHHNRFSCGTLQSELRFLFGSCRAFFGEPCLKRPQPIPSPTADLRLPYGAVPPGGDGCSSCP
jgi:hypothetical protein